MRPFVQTDLVGFDEIVAAHERISGYLNPTPLQHFPALDAVVGNGIKVLVKPELLQPTGSFKVRNAFGGLTGMTPDERRRGVIAASTGNLGQGLAYAGSMLHIPVTIAVMNNNSPHKNELIRKWGAAITEHGDTYDEAHEFVQRISDEGGPMYISTSMNSFAFAGAATVGLEIFRGGIKIDRVVHPIGSGSHAAGTAVAGRALSPQTKITGIQPANAATIHDHWHNRAVISLTRDTIADALALGPGFFSYSVSLLRNNLHDFVTVAEDEIIEAMRVLYRTTGYIAEPAGATGLAGILANRDAWQGETIVFDISGGNISSNLRNILD